MALSSGPEHMTYCQVHDLLAFLFHLYDISSGAWDSDVREVAPRGQTHHRASAEWKLAKQRKIDQGNVAYGQPPLYRQLVESLRQRISGDKLGPNDALPSENQLIEEFRVSRVTVRQALAILEKQGLIYRQQGRGTFVRPPKLQHELSRQTTTIIEALRSHGIKPEVKILELEHCVFPPDIANALQMEGAEGAKLRRLYSHQRIPIALVTLYVPLSLSGVAHMLGKDENAHETIYSIFEQKMGITIKEARHVIKTVELDAADARVLNMRPKDICLAMERLTFSMQGHPLELMTYIYPPGRMSFEMTLPRENSDLLIKRAG